MDKKNFRELYIKELEKLQEREKRVNAALEVGKKFTDQFELKSDDLSPYIHHDNHENITQIDLNLKLDGETLHICVLFDRNEFSGNIKDFPSPVKEHLYFHENSNLEDKAKMNILDGIFGKHVEFIAWEPEGYGRGISHIHFASWDFDTKNCGELEFEIPFHKSYKDQDD